MSLIEVMVSFAILAIGILGLVSGLVIASTANGFAAARTQMSAFAQSRLERIAAQSSSTICTGAVSIPGQQSCSVMLNASSPFNPYVPANTGGWMLDVTDWPPPASNAGVDVNYGPVQVLGDSNIVDEAATSALRTTIANAWTGSGATGTGCDNPLVQNNPGVLCREIYIVQADNSVPDGGAGAVAPMLQVYVRVLRGGSTDFNIGTVLLQENRSQ